MPTERPAGSENLGRLKSKLRRHPQALGALIGLGLAPASIDRLHLGIKEPYRGRSDGAEISDAVCYPLLAEGERAAGRYAYLNLPGITQHPQRPTTWGPGAPNVYRLGSFARDGVAVVAADIVDCWRIWQQAAGGSPQCAFLSRTHCEGWPPEWLAPSYWSGFSRIVVLPGEGSADFMLDVGGRIERPVLQVRLPAPHATIGSYCSDAACSFEPLLDAAEPASGLTLAVHGQDIGAAVGRFEAAPLRVWDAMRDGFAYYPFRMERRAIESSGRDQASRMVQRYETVVLRSDGHLLSSEILPAPRGTRADERVLSLSDGTRILDAPSPASSGSWSHGSIERFIDWRLMGGAAPHRELSTLLGDVERVLRQRIWLPQRDQHLLVALYVAMSHACRAFDAIPLLLVNGARGTGKSELGDLIARLSFNATVAGQLRAAGMIRLLDETRGLLVLDDMDGGGPASVMGTGELAQAIKTSYKRSTSVKPLADRGGRVRMVDFFGPKVITNTRSVDGVLGSRMLCIRTALPPPKGHGLGYPTDDGQLDALRDELHCWSMASAAEVRDAARARPPQLCRKGEIALPLRVLAAVAGGDVVRRLEAVLDDPATSPPLLS